MKGMSSGLKGTECLLPPLSKNVSDCNTEPGLRKSESFKTGGDVADKDGSWADFS